MCDVACLLSIPWRTEEKYETDSITPSGPLVQFSIQYCIITNDKGHMSIPTSISGERLATEINKLKSPAELILRGGSVITYLHVICHHTSKTVINITWPDTLVFPGTANDLEGKTKWHPTLQQNVIDHFKVWQQVLFLIFSVYHALKATAVIWVWCVL